jgi:hypothetical protein
VTTENLVSTLVTTGVQPSRTDASMTLRNIKRCRSEQEKESVKADAWIGLAEAIDALQTELSGAMLFGHGEGLQFELQPIELTLQVAVSTSGTARSAGRCLRSAGRGNRPPRKR